MAKTPSYRIVTIDTRTPVDSRTDRKAAVKQADKLAAENGVAYQVLTPGGKLVHETEAPAAPEPVEETETVEVIEEEAPAGAETDETVEVTDQTEVEAEEEPVEVAEPVVETAVEELETGPQEAAEVAPYWVVMEQRKDSDPAVAAAAKTEWERRLTIYREASRAKDVSKHIVGPAMAAALEKGESHDGRTRAALIKRGLCEQGMGVALEINEAGRMALGAALAAVA